MLSSFRFVFGRGAIGAVSGNTTNRDRTEPKSASISARATRAGSRIRCTATSGIRSARHAETASGLTGLAANIAAADGRATDNRAANGDAAGRETSGGITAGGITTKGQTTGAITAGISICMGNRNSISSEEVPNGRRPTGGIGKIDGKACRTTRSRVAPCCTAADGRAVGAGRPI
jgi:hypothetical protein